MNIDEVCVVILAAGKGSRMGGVLPKVLLKLGGKPIIYWILKTLKSAGLENINVVVGFKGELVRKEILGEGFNVNFIEQKELLGTAHSVEIALKEILSKCKTLLVLFGDDSAFYKEGTLKEFLEYHIKNKNMATFLTSFLDSPNPIGGLDIDDHGRVKGILRQSHIVKSQLKRYPILCGAFCFNGDWIKKNITKIEKSDLSGEYPLPYIYQVALSNGEYVNTFPIKDKDEWVSINTVEELNRAEKLKEKQNE